MRKILWIAAVGVPLLGGGLYGRFDYRQVCATCGCEEDCTDWQIPFTSFTYWRTSTIHSTALSRAISAENLAVPHTHNLLFATGGGNGVLCAIGDGRHLFSALESSDASMFLHQVNIFRGKETALKCTQLLLDPDRSRFVLNALDGAKLPAFGFTNQGGFDSWWRANRVDILASAPELQFLD